jgi:dCTP deaminase
MIASRKSIIEMVRSGVVGIDPEPDPVQYQPASLDVRLGEEIISCEHGHSLKGDEKYLAPGVRYLGTTEETIDMPSTTAAMLAGRSTVGRRGIIVHKTAGWVDPGFTGELTLELMNLGSSPKKLQPGDRVAQLVFFELDTPVDKGYDGSYQGQEGPTRAQ